MVQEFGFRVWGPRFGYVQVQGKTLGDERGLVMSEA